LNLNYVYEKTLKIIFVKLWSYNNQLKLDMHPNYAEKQQKEMKKIKY